MPNAATLPNAEEVAEAAVAAWATVHAALAPVVGARGVAALYKRTLFLASETHPWLAEAAAGATEPGDFTSLRAALSGREGADAAAAQQQMLQALHQLLNQLIGPALTSRLLPTVWVPPSAGQAVRDDLP
jgi:hypothetical protein